MRPEPAAAEAFALTSIEVPSGRELQRLVAEPRSTPDSAGSSLRHGRRLRREQSIELRARELGGGITEGAARGGFASRWRPTRRGRARDRFRRPSAPELRRRGGDRLEEPRVLDRRGGELGDRLRRLEIESFRRRCRRVASEEKDPMSSRPQNIGTRVNTIPGFPAASTLTFERSRMASSSRGLRAEIEESPNARRD
jgi:hypothetical protein